MEQQRSFLVIGLLLVSFLLWLEWQEAYGPQPVNQAATTNTVNPNSTVATPSNSVPSADVPSADVPRGNQSVPEATQAIASNKTIEVETDTLNIVIDLLGGDVISATLKQYPVSIESDIPFGILNNEPSTLYVAQSGLIGQDGPDGRAEGRPFYTTPQTRYEMDGDTLVVPLTFQSGNVTYVKSFVFNRGKHSIDVSYKVSNGSEQTLSLQQYAQLKQTTIPRDTSMFMPTYRGTAYSTTEKRYEKYDFSDISDENLRTATVGGWVAMLEHYFVSAWVPPKESSNTIFTRYIAGNAIIGYTSNLQSVNPGATIEFSSTLYVGPKHQEVLANLANNLEHTVDYGFLFWLAKPLFWLLSLIQSFVLNWGFAIIIITILVKGAMYPLTKAQYVSFGKMRALQPKMQALKDRYGDDRQKMSQGMMELYRKEKVNPMGGCFPLLLQMPIFLALYWVLLESVELRHADFIFWIKDLSQPDPFFVLPILTGASMWLLQKLNPTTVQDPMQQKIMQWMPVALSLFFFIFPAGLVLYWLISNLVTIVQAQRIYSVMEKKGIKTS